MTEVYKTRFSTKRILKMVGLQCILNRNIVLDGVSEHAVHVVERSIRQ